MTELSDELLVAYVDGRRVQRFSHPSHANDTDAPVWEQSCHDRRLTSRCVPTDGGGAVGKWPAERPSRGERRQATYPQRGSA